MKSTEFLQAAIDVQVERGKQYDKPSGERSMAATVSAFNCITGSMMEESDGWMFLGLLKLVRQSQNPEQYHHDSALDFVAYASLYAEAASEQCGQLEALSGVKLGDTPIEQVKPKECVVVDPWKDAPEWAMWMATDVEGAHWYESEPVMGDRGDDNWAYPCNYKYDTIHEIPSQVAKYQRPTSTAK